MTKPIVEFIGERPYVNGKYMRKMRLSYFSHCRDIYYNNEYCIKIVVDNGEFNDVEQNKNEKRIWKELRDEDRKFFAEVILCENNYMLQRFVKKSSREKTQEDNDIIDDLCVRYKLYDLNDRDDNWVISYETNLPVISDYGCVE